MTQEEKYYLDRFLKSYNRQTDRNKFNMYFDLRGDYRMRRDFRCFSNKAKNSAVGIFLRIYKNKYSNFIGGNGTFDIKLLN